jgi:hypothetical protein
MATRYKIPSTVRSVEFREKIVRTEKVGDEIVTTMVPLGWFVCFDGSRESLFLGQDKPDLIAGQAVAIIIEPV